MISAHLEELGFMSLCLLLLSIATITATPTSAQAESRRARDLGVQPGILPSGKLNAITDVAGVMVGHRTVWQGDSVRTGVTVILPHEGNIFQEKVPAAIYNANAFGKLAGYTQIEELGTLETPIALTNTLSVPAVVQALIKHTLRQPGNEEVGSVNAVAGETNDGWLNDIRGLHVTEEHVLHALQSAKGGAVQEGCVGAGTGTRCFGFKGGIGTASRRLPSSLGSYTVGVLVQTNFGGILTINGAPIGRELGEYYLKELAAPAHEEGSCMIVIATDAPLSARNLKRMAKRAVLGLARTGSIMSNGSGDYVIAFSTAYRIPYDSKKSQEPAFRIPQLLHNDQMTPLFLAVVEATEEAVYNSLFAAVSVTGRSGHTAEALPLDQTIKALERYKVLNLQKWLPGVRLE